MNKVRSSECLSYSYLTHRKIFGQKNMLQSVSQVSQSRWLVVMVILDTEAGPGSSANWSTYMELQNHSNINAGLAQLGERQTEVHFTHKSEGRVFDPHKPQRILLLHVSYLCLFFLVDVELNRLVLG